MSENYGGNFFDKVYNPERKKEYIQSDNVPESYLPLLKRVFYNSAEEERRLGKDLADFNKQQLMDFYSFMNVSSINSLINIHSQITRYIRTYCKDDDATIYQTTKSELKRHCNMSALNKKIFSKEKFDEYHMKLKENPEYNICYSFLFLGLWEGICGKELSDFMFASKDDLKTKNGKYYISLPGRELEISEELYSYGYRSAMTSTCTRRTRTGFMVNKYIPSNYIIKEVFIGKHREGNIPLEKSRASCIRKKYYKIFNMLDTRKYGMSVKSIVLSAEMDAIKQKAKEYNVTEREIIFSDKLFEALDRFGINNDESAVAALRHRLVDYIDI